MALRWFTWHLAAPYAVLRTPTQQDRLAFCAVSQHFSPPREQTVSALAVGHVLDGGGGGQTTGNGNGKERAMVPGARCFAICLVMKCHNSFMLQCCWCKYITQGSEREMSFFFFSFLFFVVVFFWPRLQVRFFDRRLSFICLLFSPSAAFMPPSPHNTDSQETSGSLPVCLPCSFVYY